MMNKKMMIGVGVGALVLLGAGSLMMKMKTDESGGEVFQTNNEIEVLDGKNEISLEGVQGIHDLMKKGIGMECTFNYDLGEMKTQGKYYFDGKSERMKMESNFTQNEIVTENYVLELPEFLYTWSIEDGVLTGYKFANEDEEEFEAETEEENWEDSEEFEEDSWMKESNLKCKKWKVDEKLFQLPDGVDFQDMSLVNELMLPEFDENGEIVDEESMLDLE